MGYDFSKINDKEFETITCDLLSEHLGQKIERFKPGRDAGVDCRFFSLGKNEVIIQCKHYLGSGYKALINSKYPVKPILSVPLLTNHILYSTEKEYGYGSFKRSIGSTVQRERVDPGIIL
jgi:hypothetical protein